MPAASKEQKIITAIVGRLQTIQIANGYQTDIGTRVEDSRPNWEEAELPAISVHQGVTTTEAIDDEGVNVIRKMAVLIDCVIKSLDTPTLTAEYARKCVSDIYLAIRSNDRWIVSTPQATFTNEVSHSIVRAEGSYEITGIQVEITIEYKAAKFNMES